MRTRIAKRLWPVPVTLGVMALAALLAFGLVATNGAQPVEAQGHDCEVTVTVAENGTPTVVDRTATDTGSECAASGDMATVRFSGPAALQAAGQPDQLQVLVLYRDRNGRVDAYENGHVEYDETDREYQLTATGASATPSTTDAADDPAGAPPKWGYHEALVPYGKRNQKTLRIESDTYELDVPKVGGITTVYLYLGNSASITEEIVSNGEPAANQRRSQVLTTGRTSLTIRFLGEPTLGMDGPDYNDDVEDDILEQCVVGADATSTTLVGEQATCGNTSGWTASTAVVDAAESRSKLVVLSTETATDAEPVLGGGDLNHDMGDRDSVTIYAVVQDENENALNGLDVTFVATPNPSDAITTRDLEQDDETELVDSTGAGAADGIDDGDAVASATYDDLADIEGAYKITVNVMVGDLNLGTVVLFRGGDPETIEAGIYAYDDCVTPSDATPPRRSQDVLNLKGDDCAMDMRYGREQMFVVDAAVKDALGTSLMDETTTVSIGDSDVLQKMTHGGSPANNAAFDVYTIKEDAAYGMSSVTVSHSDDDVADVVLNFYVAGPPAMFSISGPDTIDPGESATFTVTATDENGGIPHLTDETKMVAASATFSPTNAATVTGISNGMIELDDMGMAEIEVDGFGANAGDRGRIRVGTGDMQAMLTFSFGDAGQMPSDDLTPPTGIDVSKLLNTISVVWTPNSAQNATLIKVVLFNEDSTAIVAIKSYNPAASDPGAHDFENVAPGTYEVAVASYRPGERHELSDSHTVTIR